LLLIRTCMRHRSSRPIRKSSYRRLAANQPVLSPASSSANRWSVSTARTVASTP